MFRRSPEQPRWALMVNPSNCHIECIREEDAENKLGCGWIVVGRESLLLPFNPPRLIPDDEPLPVRRPRARTDQEQQSDGA